MRLFGFYWSVERCDFLLLLLFGPLDRDWRDLALTLQNLHRACSALLTCITNFSAVSLAVKVVEPAPLPLLQFVKNEGYC